MPVDLELTPEVIIAYLAEQAAEHGQEAQLFAHHVSEVLHTAGRRAEGITDAQARQLLLVSALENTLPRLAEELPDRTRQDFDRLYASFLLILGVVSLRDAGRKENVFQTASLTEKQKAAIALIDLWREEDATEDLDELRRRDVEFDELKSKINQWRDEEGRGPAFQ